jgi:hypothetical protein
MGHVPFGVPQSTKLGPWLFLLMINDLIVPNVSTWKYVDDTTIAETVARGHPSMIQIAADFVDTWSHKNQLQLNADKCKEMIIDFKRFKHTFDPIVVDDKELGIVSHARIIGVTMSHNLLWNDHVSDVIK